MKALYGQQAGLKLTGIQQFFATSTKSSMIRSKAYIS